MAIKQTRKSVSLNALEHALAMEAAEAAGVSLSRFTEQALRELGARRPSPDQFLAAERQSDVADAEAGTLAVAKPIVDLIANSSVGRGLANIKANGVNAELAELDKELAEVTPEQMTAVLGPPPEADKDDGVRVEYDE